MFLVNIINVMMIRVIAVFMLINNFNFFKIKIWCFIEGNTVRDHPMDTITISDSTPTKMSLRFSMLSLFFPITFLLPTFGSNLIF